MSQRFASLPFPTVPYSTRRIEQVTWVFVILRTAGRADVVLLVITSAAGSRRLREKSNTSIQSQLKEPTLPASENRWFYRGRHLGLRHDVIRHPDDVILDQSAADPPWSRDHGRNPPWLRRRRTSRLTPGHFRAAPAYAGASQSRHKGSKRDNSPPQKIGSSRAEKVIQ